MKILLFLVLYHLVESPGLWLSAREDYAFDLVAVMIVGGVLEVVVEMLDVP